MQSRDEAIDDPACHQFKVTEGEVLTVKRLAAEVGSTVELPVVFLNNGAAVIGAPVVEGAKVVAEVVSHGQGHKREGMSVLQVHEQVMGRILGFYGAIRQCPIPVVCSVHGPARAFGCALAGAADFTFASSAATFTLDEIEHGSPSTLAMSALVSRVPRKALGWSEAPFEVAADIRDSWRQAGKRSQEIHAAWKKKLAALDAPKRAEFERRMRGEIDATEALLRLAKEYDERARSSMRVLTGIATALVMMIVFGVIIFAIVSLFYNAYFKPLNDILNATQNGRI